MTDTATGERLQLAGSVRQRRDHFPMWIVKVVCSDPDCAEEQEIIVTELDEIDEAVCDCGCCVVTLAVASFEPLVLAESSFPR